MRTRALVYCIPLLLVNGDARAEDSAAKSDKVLPGMSIVGNDEAPKSLVIVPWKSSELGRTLGVSRLLDDGRQPVDQDVFSRELDYHEIRAASPGAKGTGAQ